MDWFCYDIDMDKDKINTDSAGHAYPHETILAGKERYHHVFANMRYGYVLGEVILDTEGHSVDFIHKEVNASYEKLTGLANVIGRSATEVFPYIRNTNPEFIERHLQVAETGLHDHFEIKLAPLNKWFNISVYSYQKDYFTAIIDDITERKNAEDALRRSEKRFKTLFNSHSAIQAIIDPDTGKVLDVNQEASNWYGWSVEELKQMYTRDINTLPPKAIIANLKTVTYGQQNKFIGRHRRADGSERDVEIFRNKIEIDGKPVIHVITHDITERKLAEQELIDNQKRFRQALEATHAGLWEADLHSGENIWSDEIWALYGLEKGKTKPSTQLWQKSIHPDDRVEIVQIVDDAIKQEIAINIEYRVIQLDGSVHWLMVHGIPLRDDNGNTVHYIGTSIDITDRKLIELERERLKDSQIGLNAVLNLRHIGWWEISLRDNTVYRSLEHDRIFGYESLQPLWTYYTLLDHIIPEERAEIDRQFQESIKNFSDWNIECRICRRDGEVRWVRMVGGYQCDQKGNAHRMSGIIQDITIRKMEEEERTNLQVQLLQAQKMQMVGQLAGGIAHDFNNMLTVILGHAELGLDHSNKSDECLRIIQKAASHSAELTRQLLAFAQRQKVMVQVFDINAPIEDMLSILRRLIGENITLTWIPRIQNAHVKLDPSQVVQILTNLCLNARDAIDNNGNITIETDSIYVDKVERTTGSKSAMVGDYITLTVTDNGSGIDERYLSHIFEPFFTTRDVGKGTGMGLSTVYGIVKQHNGFVDVKSQKGKGTSIIIYFPLQHHESELLEPVLPRSTKTILLVEDQPDILTLCRQIFEKSGYSVLSASGTKEAVALSEQCKNTIDLLVTGLVLPDMMGSYLFNKLQLKSPHLKVLYMSGYTPEFIARHFNNDEAVRFIEKPFSITSFMGIVKDLLKRTS